MKYTKYMTASAIAIATATALAGSATAASLQFDFIESRFFNPVDGNIRLIDNAFTDPSQIRWGQNSLPLADTSGYEFEATTPLPFTADADEIFGLGDFTHFNNTINAGTSITGVSFEVRGDVSVFDEGVTSLIGEKTFSFFIDHDETTNTAGLCPDDSPPCDDEVTISTSMGTDTFEFDGSVFTLNILGFAATLADAEDGVFNSDFFSPEGGDNTRVLAANFSVVSPDPLTPVPLPAAGWMLLAGIGGLAALRRRKKA